MEEDDLVINLAEPQTESIIKVIGVGGGGNNAVGHMFREGQIEGVRYLVCNTDRKALEDSPIPEKLQLGEGLGAGGVPERGRKLAEADVEKIRDCMNDGTKMVFITAGMGGGTGTGAAPVIAREAHNMGLLTVGVVTLPFIFERQKKIEKAITGLEEMRKYVDSLIVIVNERLFEIYNNMSLMDAFKRSDDVLTTAVRSIMDIINMRGKILLDFRDVDFVLRNGGISVMTTGYGSGERRLTHAIHEAIHSPLLNNNNYYRSSRLLMSVTFSDEEEYTLQMSEMKEIDEFMKNFDTHIETKYGIATDKSLHDKVKVTILASGFMDEEPMEPRSAYKPVNIDAIGKYYGNIGENKRPHYQTFIYNLNELDDEELNGLVDNTSTHKRTVQQYNKIMATSKALSEGTVELDE
ncbi:MAG: cell division protein FtsZ [Bacteroidaceae bacterium]|nr:cell division protein FtsZ [Bacteroidaceae bacterium]